MTNPIRRSSLAEGVSFTSLRDPKFKLNRLSVNFVTPLSEETASDLAMVSLMLRKGCRSCPDYTLLNQKFDWLYGADLSTDVTKIGADQIITFSVAAIDDRYTLGGDRLVLECAGMLRDLLFEPLIENGAFDADSFEVERRYLIDTIEDEIKDKRAFAKAECSRLMGRGDPASLRKYGSPEGARKTTPASAAKAWKRMIDTAGVEIFFTGPGDPSDAMRVFADAFAGRPAVPYVPPRILPAADAVQEHVEYMDVTQSKLVLGFRTGERPALGDQTAIRLATAILGGTPSSKLFLNVREKRSLCYYCAARYSRVSAVMMVDSGVEHENIAAAREAILKELEDLKAGDFSDETMEFTRLQMINSLKGVSDSAGVSEDWYLNRILVGEMSTPKEEIEALERTTREEVVAAARQITLDTVYLLTGKQGGGKDEN